MVVAARAEPLCCQNNAVQNVEDFVLGGTPVLIETVKSYHNT